MSVLNETNFNQNISFIFNMTSFKEINDSFTTQLLNNSLSNKTENETNETPNITQKS